MITKSEKLFFLALFTIASAQFAIGQCITEPTYSVESVETPNNTSIEFETRSETSDSIRQAEDERWTTAYGNSIELINTYKGKNPNFCYSSSEKFNCHGYAWHMAQLSNNVNTQLSKPVLITGDEILKYIDDESYTPVNHYEHPAIILWPADHSGITTEDSNIIISKWGDNGPLVKHATNAGKWMHYELEDIGTTVQYYVIHDFCDRYYSSNTYSITGLSQEYVKETTYSVNIKDYDEVEWHYSSNFVKVNESFNTITLSVNCNSNYSTGWVSATIYHAPNSIKCADTVELPRKYVFTGKPLFSYEDITFENTFGSPANYLCNSHYDNYYNVENKYDATSFDVQICNLNGQVIYQFTTSYTRRSINYTNLNGYYLFRIRGTNSCGTGDWCEIEFEYRDCSTGGGGGETGDYGVTGNNAEDLLFGPNPADDETTITINNDSDINNANFNSNDSWSIEVYNELGILVKKQVNLYGNEHTINTSDFNTGIYIVIAKNNNKILRSKLRIAR